MLPTRSTTGLPSSQITSQINVFQLTTNDSGSLESRRRALNKSDHDPKGDDEVGVLCVRVLLKQFFKYPVAPPRGIFRHKHWALISRCLCLSTFTGSIECAGDSSETCISKVDGKICILKHSLNL